MKVVYYTRPCYLDLALEYTAELAKQVELHLIIEIAPESRQSSIFDLGDMKLPTGLIDGIELFRTNFPILFSSYLTNCKNITLVIHNCPKSFHPATWRVNLKAMSFCRKLIPDIIHFDGIVPRTLAGIWSLRKIPLVCSIHDPVRHKGEENWKKELARKISFPLIDRFLLHSEAMKEQFLATYSGIRPTRVVNSALAAYNIYSQWVKAPIEDDGRTVLFFGRLSTYKGIEVLLQAAPIIAEHINGVRIIIAGKPVYDYNLPTPPLLAHKGKFEIITNYIDNGLLATLFQRATVVACPYIDASQSGVVLTAYGFNKPVIVTDIGGLPEYIWRKKTGFIVPPDDHQELAHAICNILDNQELQQEVKSNIEQMKSNEWNWQTVAANNVKIYSEIVEAK
ncbi:MAG: glycosyltransferase family 4 protein [Draconibacterium sp.]